MYTSIIATAAIFAGAVLADHAAPAAYPAAPAAYPADPAAYPAAPAAPAAYPAAPADPAAYPAAPAAPGAPAWPAPADAPPAAPAAGDKKVHVVQVGGNNGELTFSPANTVAKVGEMVQFQFWPKNHSVVQAAFASPCMPLTTTQPNVTDAFFSGFMPTARMAGSQDPLPVYTIEVTKEAPMWFYCSQGKHCQAGMVGSINSPETPERSIAIFTDKAKSAVENLSPGQLPGAVAPGAPGAPAPAGGNSTAPPATTLVPGVPGVPGAGAATGTGANPAAFTGAASGRLLDVAKNSAFGVAAIAMAFFVL